MFAASTSGPRCAVVHDITDEIDVEQHLDDPEEYPPIVMTGRYSEDNVEQALREYVSLGVPDEGKPGGRPWLVLLDEDIDVRPVVAWLDRWQIPARRIQPPGPPTAGQVSVTSQPAGPVNLSDLVNQALHREVGRLRTEHHGGKPFPKRRRPLPGGRPV